MRCGENVGKENRKTLVERILRGFCVPCRLSVFEPIYGRFG